jgi:hypothetical protein
MREFTPTKSPIPTLVFQYCSAVVVANSGLSGRVVWRLVGEPFLLSTAYASEARRTKKSLACPIKMGMRSNAQGRKYHPY